MKYAIDETELARLEALACAAGDADYSAHDDADDSTKYAAAACNDVPALIAEIRRLREALNKEHRAWQCAEGRGDGLEMENAALREKVEAWEWYGECFDNCKQRGKLPLEVHKTPSAYSEAWASLWAAREAVHADRE